MNRNSTLLTSLVALSLVALPGCSSDENDAEPTQAGSCTIVDKGDGLSAIRCPDGSELVVKNGQTGVSGRDGTNGKNGLDGANGKDGKDANPTCTLTDNGDGTHSLTCGDKSVVIGDSCEGGFQGDLWVTDPANSPALSLTLFQVTGCTWIGGSVYIDEYPGEALPKALSRIETIDGHVIIGWDYGNAALETVSFPKLKAIGGDLWIYGNEALKEIQSFPRLESIGGWLSFGHNSSLETAGSFDVLTKVGPIELWDNPLIESLPEFPVLETLDGVGDGPDVDYPLVYIDGNGALRSIEGLSHVTFVDGDVRISNNPELAQSQVDELLDGMEITGDVFVCGNKDGDACP